VAIVRPPLGSHHWIGQRIGQIDARCTDIGRVLGRAKRRAEGQAVQHFLVMPHLVMTADNWGILACCTSGEPLIRRPGHQVGRYGPGLAY
jgi:hypothetical protein